MVIMQFPCYKIFFFWIFPLLNNVKFIIGWPTLQQYDGRLNLTQGQWLGHFYVLCLESAISIQQVLGLGGRGVGEEIQEIIKQNIILLFSTKKKIILY